MSLVRERLSIRSAAVLAGLLAGAGAATSALVAPAPGATTTSLRASFTMTSSWQGGYVGQYTVTDAGSAPVSSWQLEFQLPAGASLTNSWSGDATVSGSEVSVTNAAWNGSISPGGSTTFGFQVADTAGNGAPGGCLVDAAPCSGTLPLSQPGTTTSAPTTTQAAAALRASFGETASWTGGYVGQFSIANDGSVAATSWQLSFTLPAGVRFVDAWSGTAASSGQTVTVTNAAWNGSIAPGSSAAFGFQVTDSPDNAPPASCSLVGGTCGVTWSPTTTSPAPTTTSPAPTTTSDPTSTVPASTSTVPASTSTVPTSTVAPPPPTPGPTELAPYVDMTLENENLAAISATSGIKDFTLAFIVTKGACTPSWGSYIPVGGSGDYVGGAIAALRAAGGNVIVSFGGEANTELANSCTSVASLEAAYQKVVDTYHAYDLDFDIEGAAVGQSASIAERSAALALLQKDEAVLGHRVSISLTLPVLPQGFPVDEINVIRSAASAGVRLSVVNPMTMDYGGAAPDPAGNMGNYAIEAARAVEAQLAAVYPSYTPAQLWAMVGITPMIGQNDIPGEVFTVADAQQVATFAAANGVGRLSMWSTTRDVQCAQGIVTYDDPTCSGIIQSPWAFAHAFEQG